MPGMEMTPNGGMMMDPNAVGEGALSGGRPAKGTPLYCMSARGALGQVGPGCLQHGFCLVYAVLFCDSRRASYRPPCGCQCRCGLPEVDRALAS